MYTLVRILCGEVTPILENIDADTLLSELDKNPASQYTYVVYNNKVLPVQKFLLDCLASTLSSTPALLT
jgi:hypothetical protein